MAEPKQFTAAVIDDPFELNRESPVAEQPYDMPPLPTGIDETDDATRQLGIHLQEGTLFCIRCEVYFVNEIRCKHCNWSLNPVGTPVVGSRRSPLTWNRSRKLK